MVLGKSGRGVQHKLFAPIARVLVRIGVTPNAVTIAGTVLTAVVALTLLPLGHLVVGALALGVLVLSDSIDGIMARESGAQSPYGAFLDSSLDRIADSAIFAGVLMWFLLHTSGPMQVTGVALTVANLALGGVVPYVRAKAESLGVDVSIGLAERADRIIAVLVATLLTGLGVPVVVFVTVLALLAMASLVTVLQRIAVTKSRLVSNDA